MTEHVPGGLPDDEAERLLAAAADGRWPAHDPLAQLLRAAAAPARPGELNGLDTALAAFRAATATPVARGVVRSRVRRFAILKITAIAGALSLGGVALASSVGVLPNPFVPDPSDSPALVATEPAYASPSRTPGPVYATASGRPVTSPSAAPLPTTGLRGLCHAYLSDPDRESGKALEKPAFAALITAAGGTDKVESFCIDLTVEKSTTPSPEKSTKARPSQHNSAR